MENQEMNEPQEEPAENQEMNKPQAQPSSFLSYSFATSSL